VSIRSRTGAAALLFVALGSADGGPASQERQAQQPPIFRSEANYVRVDAYPTQDGAIVPDLTASDFEILEDGVAQRVEHCEFVRVQSGSTPRPAPQPETLASSRTQAVRDRARVFVLFLDAYHVGIGGSARVRTALPAFLRRLLGPDDVIGAMTPFMPVSAVALTRRTEPIEAMLEREWAWGRRDQAHYREPEELNYEVCYPESSLDIRCVINGREVVQPASFYSGIAREMIERRRERISLDALAGLVEWLHGVREERKAVVAVSDGWRLVRPDATLTRLGVCDQDAGAASIAPRTPGRPAFDPNREGRGALFRSCEADRQMLAGLDNMRAFRDLLDRANRANVSFYPVDPRGLSAFDSSMSDTKVSESGVTQPLLTPSEDAARLTSRIGTLRTLASATDGVAVVDGNDIAAGLRRIEADMASYYLLGYYSTNTKLDGRFRAITVKARRPGVQVRARRGYLAATPAEVSAAAPIAGARGTDPGRNARSGAPTPSALAEAVAGLASRASSVRMQVSWLADAAGTGGARMWWVIELDPDLVRPGGEFAPGAEIAATVASPSSGDLLGQRRARLPAGARVAVLDFAIQAPDPAGYVLRLHARPTGGAGLPITDTVRAPPAAGAWPVGTAQLFRQRPGAGRPFEPTADPRFSRSERLRVEVPAAGEIGAVDGQLLDRTGKPLKLPVDCSIRPAAGQDAARAACDITIAPLAAGDYGIRLTVTAGGVPHEAIAAFRVQ
jgi:VWFA-related protein